MTPQPKVVEPTYRGSGKLGGKVALVTGGDSGIGRAVAVLFAREGANVAIAYLNEHKDAAETVRLVEAEGRGALAMPGDVGQEAICQQMVRKTIERFGRLDILVNNASEQHPQEGIEKISSEQLERTFRTNVFSYFYCTKAALPHL